MPAQNLGEIAAVGKLFVVSADNHVTALQTRFFRRAALLYGSKQNALAVSYANIIAELASQVLRLRSQDGGICVDLEGWDIHAVAGKFTPARDRRRAGKTLRYPLAVLGQ